jgi:hypothetical protein
VLVRINGYKSTVVKEFFRHKTRVFFFTKIDGT